MRIVRLSRGWRIRELRLGCVCRGCLRDGRESRWTLVFVGWGGSGAEGGYPIDSMRRAIKSPWPRRMYFLNALR